MPRLVVPDREQIRSVLDESYALWGAGLSLAHYHAMWEELAVSRWARAWYGWRGLIDDEGRLVSSLKLYRPLLRIGDRASRACVIGAVFTSRAHRRLGYAATLIRAVLDEAAGRGETCGLLFTDIGTPYYAQLGFAALPCEDALGSLVGGAARAPRDVTLRAMDAADLDDVAAAHAASCARRDVAILRDRDHWEFLLLRAASFFGRLDGTDLSRRFMIAEDASGPIGFLIGVAGPGEWNLREAAAFDGDDRTLARILAAGAAQASGAGATTVWGWIPRAVWPLVPEWRLRAQPRLRAVPMIRPPLDARTVSAGDDLFVPYLDQF